MQKNNEQIQWEEFCATTLKEVGSLLKKHDVTLDDNQPHLKGERFLMQAVTTQSGRKLILLGTYHQTPVVIKITNDKEGEKEIEHERRARALLSKIKFAYQVFHSPQELLHVKEGGYTINIQEFIEQEQTFLSRPTSEQFEFALGAFKAQESAHATTYEHEKNITELFDCIDSFGYQKNFSSFIETLSELACYPTLLKVKKELENNALLVDQYGRFLTHTDFVPHNFRIKDDTIYLLDHSSLRFGNKYEGWARFLNFMSLYNPELEEALLFYVENNRTPDEYKLLRLMRLYRLGEIIHYYQETLKKSSGNLRILNEKRVEWWGDVLEAVYSGNALSREVRNAYIQTRDSLRDSDEKERQKDLH